MFDAHTHLNGPELYSQRPELLQEFIDHGWTGLINIGVNQEYNTNGITICEHTKDLSNLNCTIRTTIGLHPYEVACGNITRENLQGKINQLYSLYTSITSKYIVAIGEIGIDTYRPDTDHTLDLQKQLFRLQCERARKLQLPIVIHSRANRSATHEILQDFTDLKIYFHCRSYTAKEIKIIKESYPNFYIGFTGNITYTKAIDIRKSLRYLSHEDENYPEHVINGKIKEQQILWNPATMTLWNLIIETDAPYLPPVPYRGQQNKPAYIAETYKYISALLWKDITQEVINNTKQCYHL